MSIGSMSMKMNVKESRMVRPMEETPSGSLWLSNLDLLMPATHHTRTVYFYRSHAASAANFFHPPLLKTALARALVHFYPYAGRLKKKPGDDGRIEINCNAEGVLFVEAECDATLSDLGAFDPRPDLTLVPNVNYSQGLSSFPLLLLQAWQTSITFPTESPPSTSSTHGPAPPAGLAGVPPFFDRRLLSARRPPHPKFPHIEHHPPPPLKTPHLHMTSDKEYSTFRLTADHIKTLNRKCESEYTTYEVVSGHVWRCVCMARRLPHDQETKLQIPVDGRPRLRPPLPAGFFGNGIFYTTSTALCGELVSKPLEFAAGKVHAALIRMDDEYLRSALDYLELQLPNIDDIARSEKNVRCPNFGMTSWVRLPFYEADFGWGKPVYAGPGAVQFEGKGLLFVDSEGSLLLAISLLKPHMELFQNLLYQI